MQKNTRISPAVSALACLALLLPAAAWLNAGPQASTPAMSSSDAAQVEAIARDYIEGWYTGDAARMERALHAELVKRMPVSEGSTVLLRPVSRSRMVELTASGGGENPGAAFEIVVDDVSTDIATVRVASPDYLDYLHLAKTGQGWKIVNVLFHPRG